jgi:hypothetical protein
VLFSGDLPLNVPTVIRYRVRLDEDATPGSILYSQADLSRGDGNTFVASASVAVVNPQPVETLVLLYAVGDNNLSRHMQPLFQKAEATVKPHDMVVLLLLDDIGQDGAYVPHSAPYAVDL